MFFWRKALLSPSYVILIGKFTIVIFSELNCNQKLSTVPQGHHVTGHSVFVP